MYPILLSSIEISRWLTLVKDENVLSEMKMMKVVWHLFLEQLFLELLHEWHLSMEYYFHGILLKSNDMIYMEMYL